MTQKINANDERLQWAGAVSVEEVDGGVRPWRIDHKMRALFPPDHFRDILKASAGIRIVFCSDTTSLTIHTREGENKYPRIIDICVDGEVVQSAKVNLKDRVCFDGLASGMKRIEIWLPLWEEFWLGYLEVDDQAVVEHPGPDDRPKWLTYGSSISQCVHAENPTQSWPGIVARRRNLNLTCMGFGGSCFLDPMVALTIAQQPADIISFFAGVNICSSESHNMRSFAPAVIGFVQIIRQAKPTTPIIAISQTHCAGNYLKENGQGMTLEMYREQMHQAVETMIDAGDKNLHFVNGYDLFGPAISNWDDLMIDECHPNAEGFKVLADQFDKQVAGVYFP